MELSQAEVHLRECLRAGSRLSKALTSIQEIAGYGDPTRRCAKAVGETLGWFHFEVLSPLERQFPQFSDWSFSTEDWSPEFTIQPDPGEAFAAFDRAASDCRAVGQNSVRIGIASSVAAKRLDDLVEECRSAGRAVQSRVALPNISGSESLVELRQHLGGQLETDSELSRHAVSKFIDRYLNDELTHVELQEIGDLLEMSVEYEQGYEEVIAQVLFEMSSPELNGDVNRERATEWKSILTNKKL